VATPESRVSAPRLHVAASAEGDDGLVGIHGGVPMGPENGGTNGMGHLHPISSPMVLPGRVLPEFFGGLGQGQAVSAIESASVEDSESSSRRKRDRERRRRETMNEKFEELAGVLSSTTRGKAVKETILAESIEHIRRQNSMIEDMKSQIKLIRNELDDARLEKQEFRLDQSYLRRERDALRDENKRLRMDLNLLSKFYKTNGAPVDAENGADLERLLPRRENHRGRGSPGLEDGGDVAITHPECA